MDKEELRKFNLEESVAEGLLTHMQDLDSSLIPELDSNDGRDLLVHLQYSEREQRYEYAIYREK